MSVATDVTIETPYLGLRYFDEEHAHLFFGREVQAHDILEKLRRSRLVTVMGSSGSGKSSLVRAGVVPSLKAAFLSDAGARWRIAKMRPGSSPLSSLARELEKAFSVSNLEVTLRRGPLGLIQAVGECRLPARENVLVIADQFEELFRYQRESDHPQAAKEEAAAFVKLLLEATSQRSLPIYVIVTMRSDYLGNCAQFRDLPERINDGLYLVPRMRRDQLEQAITGPVAVVDAAIAPRLVQRLLNDTGDDPDQLPVLQHALLRAWNTWNRASRPLDLEDLEAVGGMKDSLSNHADEIFASFSADEQRIARVVFTQLSDRDAEGREVRRPAPVTQIAAVSGVTVQAVEDIVKKFAAPEAALLSRNEDGHLDITHESLIRKWRLIQGTKVQGGADVKGWMQEEVDARDQFELLIDRMTKQDTLGGRALEDALGWRALGLNADWARRHANAGGAGTTFQDVLHFVAECKRSEDRRRRLRNGLMLGAMVAVAIFVALIWQQKSSADRAAHAARVAVSHASLQEAVRLIGTRQTGQGLAHLARALRADPDSLAARSWFSDLVFNEHLWIAGANLEHKEGVKAVAFSPDGRLVVTASDDDTARVWDAATGQPVGAALQHQGDVWAVSFSPDGRRVITASADYSARVWDAATGGPVGAPLRHEGPVHYAAFSPDGQRVVTGSSDNTARVWDPATGQSVLLRHNDDLTVVAFSPDGRRVVTGSADNTARVWDAATGRPVTPPLPQGVVWTAAFSPDGRHVVTASSDNTVRVWDAATGQPVGAPLEHQGTVNAVAFSPDGRRIVTASDDQSARIWAADGRPGYVQLQHEGLVHSAVFSPDGRRIVTTSNDHTARVWDAETGQSIGVPLQHLGVVWEAFFSSDGTRIVTASYDHSARVWAFAGGRARLEHRGTGYAAAFSPDGSRVVTALDDDTARIWDASTGQPVGVPLQHKSDVNVAAFSADGRRVVTASGNSAHLWDAATGQPVGVPLQHQGGVDSALFSPNGRHVVTASDDKTARVWDAVTGQPVGVPLQHKGDLTLAVFSADGRHVVTASSDDTAQIWDATTGQRVGAPLQHKDDVFAADFSSDGRRVITASRDKTARVWDAASGAPVGAPLEHPDGFRTASFSPDGRHVLTSSYDNSARVWDAATGQPVSAPLRHTSTVNVAAFSPDGRLVVTASADKTARVWDAASGAPVGAPLQHGGPVDAAAFSPDGRRVATGSGDSTARVWDTASGTPVGAPLQHHGGVYAIAFSLDGQRVVTSSYDGTARVWLVLLRPRSTEHVQLWADLAEVVGGYRVSELNSVVPLEERERLERVRRLVGPQATAFVPVDVLLRPFRDPQR